IASPACAFVRSASNPLRQSSRTAWASGRSSNRSWSGGSSTVKLRKRSGCSSATDTAVAACGDGDGDGDKLTGLSVQIGGFVGTVRERGVAGSRARCELRHLLYARTNLLK